MISFFPFPFNLIVIKTLTESFAFDTHPANDPIYFLKYKKEKLLGKKKTCYARVLIRQFIFKILI